MDADQFQLGDEIADVERRQPHGGVISVRLGPEGAERLYAEAQRSGRTLSEIVRAAIDGYLVQPTRTPGTVVVNISLGTPSALQGPVILSAPGGSEFTSAPPVLQDPVLG